MTVPIRAIRWYRLQCYAWYRFSAIVSSDRSGCFEFGYEHPNIPIWSYLQSFFHRRIGASADRVLNDFYRLGWKNVKEMYYYWDSFVLPLHEHVKWPRNYYYIRDGVLAYCA